MVEKITKREKFHMKMATIHGQLEDVVASVLARQPQH